MKIESVVGWLRKMLVAGTVLAWCAPAGAQAECGASGYRVVASRWDGVLGRGWELRQDCAHPEWPARLVAADRAGPSPAGVAMGPVVAPVQPLMVRAGDLVRLWEQDATVRIEMSGIAEQSARMGERVVVRITRQNDDTGLTVNRIDGIVRGAGDVEMER